MCFAKQLRLEINLVMSRHRFLLPFGPAFPEPSLSFLKVFYRCGVFAFSFQPNRSLWPFPLLFSLPQLQSRKEHLKKMANALPSRLSFQEDEASTPFLISPGLVAFLLPRETIYLCSFTRF